MKISFVVLQYLNSSDTIECVESIINTMKKFKTEYDIVIVDNGSTNDAYQVVMKRFNNQYLNLHIIRSTNNLGFSRGNNLGFLYAKKNLLTDYIIMLNNDIILNDSFNPSLINDLYYEYNYSVLGPDIKTLEGKHQNPFLMEDWTKYKLLLLRFKLRIKKVLLFLRIDLPVKNKLKEEYNDQLIINAGLHGSFLIFSPLYIQLFDGLCDETFLFMEEDILKLQLKANGLISLYTPDISVLHKEDRSINQAINSKYKRKIAKYNYNIQSSYIYQKKLMDSKKGKK